MERLGRTSDAPGSERKRTAHAFTPCAVLGSCFDASLVRRGSARDPDEPGDCLAYRRRLAPMSALTASNGIAPGAGIHARPSMFEKPFSPISVAAPVVTFTL